MNDPKKKKRKGNPYVPLRIPPDLLAWIDEQCAKSQDSARGEPYDRSSFIRACIVERREKYRRAKESQAKKKGGKGAGENLETIPSDLSHLET